LDQQAPASKLPHASYSLINAVQAFKTHFVITLNVDTIAVENNTKKNAL
jgi:hypothetical protein